MTTSVTTSRENGRLRVAKEFPNPSKTEQSHRDKVNINSIMRRARKQGVVPVYNKEATYGDFTNAVDYQTALNRIIQAEKHFGQLPAEVIKRFDNDPAKLIEFMESVGESEAALKEAQELGLAEIPKEPEVQRVEVVNPPQQEPPQTGSEEAKKA